MTIAAKLPSWLTVTGVSGSAGFADFRSIFSGAAVECFETPLHCTYAGTLPPYENLEVKIAVKVAANAPIGEDGEEGEVLVTGGGAREVSVARHLTVGESEPSFGVEGYELAFSNEDGSPDTQAGSHPFQLTSTVSLNRRLQNGQPVPAALTKGLQFKLPPGLVGNPTPLPQCTDQQFANGASGVNECPANTAIGVSTTELIIPNTFGSKPLTVPSPCST